MSFFIPLLAALLFWAWRAARRRLVLERRESEGAKDLARAFLPHPETDLYGGVEFRRARIEARRHHVVGRGELSDEDTVDATVRRLGFFTPVYRSRLQLPLYLALVDRATFKDQQAALADEFLDRLAEGGVEIERLYFDRDPRLCAPEREGATQRSIEELAGAYSGHRLLVFSDGSGLTHPVTGRSASWTEVFGAWRERALLTPVAPCHWGLRELDLIEIGFQVAPASANGLLLFVEGLRKDTAKFSWRPPYPELLVENPRRFLDRMEPPRDEVENLLGELRAYLGRDGYRWLGALAVYPELSWYLTIYFGLELKSPEGLPLFSEDRLWRLTQLPWLRYGFLPDWLRLRLIDDLSAFNKGDEGEIRASLDRLLRRALWGGSG